MKHRRKMNETAMAYGKISNIFQRKGDIQKVMGTKMLFEEIMDKKCSKSDENFKYRNSRSSTNLSKRNNKNKKNNFNEVHKNQIAENH